MKRGTNMSSPVHASKTAKIETHLLRDDGRIPNNPVRPLLVYRSALPLDGRDPAADCEAIFTRNDWGNGWRNGVYSYHHYHATAHEVLGIVRGEARVRFGGDAGPVVAVRAGDVVVIPAGVGHKNEGASPDLLVIGAYPAGTAPDRWTDRSADRERAIALIRKVPMPARDPLYGEGGPLIEQWTKSDPQAA
jgi:uncharacterized protein YjlB